MASNRQDADRGTIEKDGATLVGRQWFVNLRSTERTFDTRTFADSVLVREVTDTYVSAELHDQAVAVIPWSSIAFLSSSPA